MMKLYLIFKQNQIYVIRSSVNSVLCLVIRSISLYTQALVKEQRVLTCFDFYKKKRLKIISSLDKNTCDRSLLS